jgi:hypothetical protein
MVEHSVVQDNKIRNIVDAVNNNDSIGQRQSEKIAHHMKDVEKDTNTKLLNVEKNIDSLREGIDDNMRKMDENIKVNINTLSQGAVELNTQLEDLDHKYDMVTFSNQVFTVAETERNENRIKLLGYQLSNLNSDLLEQEQARISERAALDADIERVDSKVNTEVQRVEGESDRKLQQATTAFDGKLNPYAKVADLQSYIEGLDHSYLRTDYATTTNLGLLQDRVRGIENSNIDSLINIANADIRTLHDMRIEAWSNITFDIGEHTSALGDFRASDYYAFSNEVTVKQQKNFDNLLRQVDTSLTVDDGTGNKVARYATMKYLQDTLDDDYYTKDATSNLFQIRRNEAIADMQKYMQENTSDFRGEQGVQGVQGKYINAISSEYDTNMNKKKINFQMIDPSKNENEPGHKENIELEMPYGKHGNSANTFSIDNHGVLSYIQTTYDSSNNATNTRTDIGNVKGADGNDGKSVASIRATSNNGNKTVVTVTYNDDTTNTFEIDNAVSITDIIEEPDITEDGVKKTKLIIKKSDGKDHEVKIPHGRDGINGTQGATGTFQTDDVGLTLDTTNGLCFTYGNDQSKCVPMNTLQQFIYTKSEYIPADGRPPINLITNS